jgi:hypothetical protein
LKGGGADEGGHCALPRAVTAFSSLDVCKAAVRESTCGVRDIMRGMSYRWWWDAAAPVAPLLRSSGTCIGRGLCVVAHAARTSMLRRPVLLSPARW